MQLFPGLEHQPFVVGDGPATTVAVHGFPGTPAEVRPMAAALAAMGWRVRAPLLPGFGPEWSTLEEQRWQTWRDTVARELEHASADAAGAPVMLLGFSMGAALALAALHDSDADVDGLVLIAPFTRLPDPRAALLPLVKRFIPTFRPYEHADLDDARVRRDVQTRLGTLDLDDPAIRARLREEVTVPTAAADEARRVGLHALRIAPRLRARPTLVVQGLQDTTVLPRDTIALLRRLPGRPLRLFLEDADHRIVLPDAPGHREMLRALQRFGLERLGLLNTNQGAHHSPTPTARPR